MQTFLWATLAWHFLGFALNLLTLATGAAKPAVTATTAALSAAWAAWCIIMLATWETPR